MLFSRFPKIFFLAFKVSKEKDTSNISKQIPVISDIERIKKVIEIIEFVGDKVGDVLDNLQALTERNSIETRTTLSETLDTETTTVNR